MHFERELLARNIMNIIDEKNHFNYVVFNDSDLEIKLHDYLIDLTHEDDAVDNLIKDNKPIIDKIASNKDITIQEKNNFMNSLIFFKLKYIMHKDI
ncbi:MAG: hypothetical protein LUG12_08985 [Erysipelotrichaceae bacterium]|nr:hypothetical protein [Erysipelotrichaceae bacterium]